MVNSKIHDLTDWAKRIKIRILSNISRRKINQAIKYGQLIEYSIRNIFVENTYLKYGGEANPRPFHK